MSVRQKCPTVLQLVGMVIFTCYLKRMRIEKCLLPFYDDEAKKIQNNSVSKKDVYIIEKKHSKLI